MQIVDVLFHVHPNLAEESRINLEEIVSANNGVMHANFSDMLFHKLKVSYDPDAIRADTLLEQVREFDEEAMMVGL